MRKLVAILAAALVCLSLSGQGRVEIRPGVDVSTDFFLPVSTTPSFGLGVSARAGTPEQWINLVGKLRFIYGPRLQGFQIPLMLNANLLRGDRFSGYLGAGYEFDFIGTYWGCMKYQLGLAGRHVDARLFYKPYQGDLGIGFTYYF